MGRLLLVVALIAAIALAGAPQTKAFGWEKVDAILSKGIADHTTPGLQALVADASVRISLLEKHPICSNLPKLKG